MICLFLTCVPSQMVHLISSLYGFYSTTVDKGCHVSFLAHVENVLKNHLSELKSLTPLHLE